MTELSTQADPAVERELTVALVESANQVARLSRRVARDATPRTRTQPQIALARVVRRTPGVSVRDAAHELGLAPNTISTLVGQLVEADWLERRTDSNDGRVARLHLTQNGEERMAAWRERRDEAVAGALHEAVRRLGVERVRDSVEVLDLVASLMSAD